MPDRLLLRLASDGRLSWLLASGDGRGMAVAQVGAPPASVLADAKQIVVLVPSEDVLLTQARLTVRNRAQLLQAVPYAIEDQLLGAVEDQHFAVTTGSDDQVGIAVVAKLRLQEWLALLANAGIRADILIPETLALPLSADAASALVEGDRVLARFATWSGFACASADFPQWLEQVRAVGHASALDIHDFDGTLSIDALLDVRAPAHDHQRDALAFLGAHLGTPAINLLSGDFAPGHRQARGTRWWRRAAALAAAVVVVAFVQRAVEVTQLSRAVERVDAAMAESLNGAFPDLGAAERSRTPESVMRSRLERLRGGSETSGFLRVLGQIAPILGTTTRTQMRGLEYRNATLEISLRAPDVQTLDSMRERFAATPGLSAELTATNPLENATDGRIRIQGAKP